MLTVRGAKPYRTRSLQRVNYSVEEKTLGDFQSTQPHDWYISQNPSFDRPLILAICYVMSNFLPTMPRLSEIFQHRPLDNE